MTRFPCAHFSYCIFILRPWFYLFLCPCLFPHSSCITETTSMVFRTKGKIFSSLVSCNIGVVFYETESTGPYAYTLFFLKEHVIFFWGSMFLFLKRFEAQIVLKLFLFFLIGILCHSAKEDEIRMRKENLSFVFPLNDMYSLRVLGRVLY